MGLNNFNINLKLNPEFVRRVIEKVAQIQLDGIRERRCTQKVGQF